MAYITPSDLRDWTGARSGIDDAIVTSLCASTSAAIDAYCGRTFTADSVATARVFHSGSYSVTPIADAFSITAVATDLVGLGTYATTWSVADYYTEPLNGVGQNGHTGWPATRIMARQSKWFYPAKWPDVQVTAKWGWATVPDDVRQACLMLAAELLASKDAPLGITASDVGGIQVRGNLRVQSLLNPFTTATAASGKFLVA
jgi:hypothetical protein